MVIVLQLDVHLRLGVLNILDSPYFCKILYKVFYIITITEKQYFINHVYGLYNKQYDQHSYK